MLGTSESCCCTRLTVFSTQYMVPVAKAAEQCHQRLPQSRPLPSRLTLSAANAVSGIIEAR